MDYLVDLVLAAWLGWLTWDTRRPAVSTPDVREVLRDLVRQRVTEGRQGGSGRDLLRARLARKLATKEQT